ncbi:MAG TPA: CcoQ/FixQ family Cbb3-type cytochrome c oxidase assembly chaperone [Burkholderiales bacterium]|nr:CcoQ/FixQ family Cbb3-type cytochrome c oxidase assembly chaperone [Burkholderiales bacterium]
MEINDLRAAITLLSFFCFIGIVIWAYSSRRTQRFSCAARSVLEEGDAS